MANPEHLARLKKSVDAWNDWKRELGVRPDLSRADLRSAKLSWAELSGADLCRANLNWAILLESDLIWADLFEAHLNWADLRKANLSKTRLSKANLVGANLSRANLEGADLSGADLRRAHLINANLKGANLNLARLSEANLISADCRSANLQYTKLDGSTITDIRLWETQRAGWSIKGVICERAYWNKDTGRPTEYAPGEFERLYSDQICIELFYMGGVSTFELNTLPALLHHLASLHPGTNIRLKSIEETGGGAKISISVGDAAATTAEKIKSDAMQVYQAQIALREDELNRERIEKKYLEKLLFGQLIPAMLTAGTPQIVFNAPVNGVVISNDESIVDFNQTFNDNSALLALLEKIMDRSAELGLGTADAAKLDTEIQIATTELQKKNPRTAVVSKSIKVIKTIATEALAKTVVEIGKCAASVDWHTLLNHLSNFVTNLK